MEANSEPVHGASAVAGGLALVVVNYGSHALIEANFAGIDLAGLGVECIVVDNFSDTRELLEIRRVVAANGWRLVESSLNVGFGAAVNLGVRLAAQIGRSELLLVNPDAAVTAEVIVELGDQVRSERRAAVSPRIETQPGTYEFRGSQVQLADGHMRRPRLSPLGDQAAVRIDGQVDDDGEETAQGWLSGACLAMSMELFEQAGGFDESYFLYWEDVDLSRRIERVGGQLLVRHDLQVSHSEGGTQRTPKPLLSRGGRARSSTYYYYNCRNRLAFAARHLDRAGILRWIVRTPKESWQILKRGGRRQLLESPRPLLATIRGSLAGLLIALKALVHPQVRPAASSSMLFAHPGAELYGSDRMLLESVCGLSAAGRDVTVVLPGPGPLVGELVTRGVRVEFCPMPVLRKSALHPIGLALLVVNFVRGLVPATRLILRHGRGGVYVNTVTIPSWLVLARVLRRPAVFHVHEAEQSAPRLVRRVIALQALCAQRIIVNSEYSLGVLIESLPSLRSRTTVVYNGVVGPADLEPARTKLSGPLKLLYLGRLSPRKGPDVALAAVRTLVERGMDVEIELLGSVFPGYEWFDDQLRAEAGAPALLGRVRFLGFEADVWPRLAAADIVIVPSVVDEPFGNTAVEALLAARPAVVSATSGLREAAAGYRTAVMVEPNDAVAVADAVAAIAADWENYGPMAAADAVQARERHSTERYRDEVVAAVLMAGA